MHNNPSASIATNSNLAYNVPIVNISGSNHPTFPNQILFYYWCYAPKKAEALNHEPGYPSVCFYASETSNLSRI